MNHTANAMRDTQLLLEQYFQTLVPISAQATPVLKHSYSELSRLTLAGKHIRSRLVHIAAGRVEGSRYDAAVAFGAAVNLLHGAFLVHDDFIDADCTRRGEMSLHNSLGQLAQDVHIGDSLAVLAGDMAIAGAIDLACHELVPVELHAPAVRILVDAMTESIHGELSDVAHRVPQSAHTLNDVRLSNHMKTSAYTFRAPLMLGALAAGRDLSVMVPIANSFGFAFQAADDVTGHQGDIEKQRVTMVTARLNSEGDSDLAVVLKAVAAEARASLEDACDLAQSLELPSEVKEGLMGIAALMDENLHKLGV